MSNKELVLRCVFFSSKDADIAKKYLLYALARQPIEDYEPGIFSTPAIDHKYKDQDFKLHLWDTSGQEEYDKLRPMSYAKCDVAVLIFRLDNKKTLNDLELYIKELKEYADKSTRVLIGLNCDKKKNDDDGECEPVSDEEMEGWAKQNGVAFTLKHTIKDDKNLDNILDFFIENYLATHKKEKECNIA